MAKQLSTVGYSAGHLRQEKWDRVQEKWYRRCNSRDVRQEMWDRRQETGDVIPETGDIRQDKWDKCDWRHEIGDMIMETWERRRETGDWNQSTPPPPFCPSLSTVQFQNMKTSLSKEKFAGPCSYNQCCWSRSTWIWRFYLDPDPEWLFQIRIQQKLKEQVFSHFRPVNSRLCVL